MFKTKQEIIVIQAEAVNPIPTNVVFWSHDHGTAKLIFQLKKDQIFQSLPDGTIVPVCLEFNSATAENGRGKHIYHAVIEDAINGIVSIVLEDNVLGYQGIVDGSIYIELPDSRSLDTAGRFTFAIKRSPIDDSTPELEDYYYQGFEQILSKSKSLIDGVKKDCQTVLDNLTAEVKDLTTQTQAIQQKQADIQEQIDSGKLVTEDDVYLKDETFNKVESSANVIDTIGGATSTIFKDEMLVNGVEAVASRNNNGTLEPFSQADYDDLDNSDKYVRSETLLNGRGAAIDCEFPVIEILEKRHPWMFKNTSTLTEKIQTYLSYNPTFKIPFAARGRGILTSNNVESSRSMMYQKRKNGSWIGVASGTSTNIISNFVTYGNEGWGKTHFDEVLSDGNYTFRVCSKNNDITAAGCISDGVTPAWVELRDIKLIVEFEANGRTVVESIVAANQVESIATGEEAEAGESNSVFMTPNLVFKAIAKWVQGKFVSTAGNETILGTKNFQDGIQVKGKLPVLTKSVNDYASVDKNNNASVISDGSMRLYRRGDIVYLTGSFKLSAAKYNQAVWFNVPSWAAPIDRPRMYWSSGSNFYLLAFDPSTINNIICIDNVAQDTWLTGSFCWLARDPY